MSGPIIKALSSGFTSKQIVDYLIRKFPQHETKIKNALAMGFNPNQVISYLTKGRTGLNDYQKAVQTEHEKTRESELQKESNINKGALALGAAAIGGPLLGEAAGAIRGLPSLSQVGIGRQIGSAQNQVLGMQGQQLQQPASISKTIPQQQPPIGQVSPNIAQPQQVTQPKGIINPREYLEKLGIKDKVDDLLKRGNTPEQAAASLGMKGGTGKIKAEIDPELLANIDAYSKEPKVSTSVPTEKVEDVPVASNMVASPHGIGEVVTARNGKAIVSVDGKKHQVEEAKLLKPPKEAAIEALELIKSFTPEQQRSTHHMLNAYDAEEKKGFFVFHNGSAYIVDDISPEEYKELSEEVEAAKTTGETIIGQWAAGEGSRGAGYNKIVKGVRERKVVPGLKKKYRKLKVGYNLLSEWQKLLGEHAKELRSQGNQTSE